MKKLIVLFSIIMAFIYASQAQLTIPYIITAPTIDGVSNDWSETWIYQTLEKDGAVTHDMASKFQIGHDGDNIYLIFQVIDATPNNDATAIQYSYERDCIEVYFSMHSVTEEPAYVPGDWWLRIQRATDLETIFEGKSETYYAEAAGEFVVAVDDDGTSMYTIEMQLSIATLAQDSDFDGENLRMDFITSDNTTGANGGRTQQMFWNDNSDNQWHNVNLFGDAVLAEVDPNQLIANFSADKTAGIAPLTVSFTDESSGSPIAWSWDFNNDGIVDANSQNPSYTYTNVGIYSVSSTVTDVNESKTIIKSNYISVSQPHEGALVVPFATAPTIDGIIDSNDPWSGMWISQDKEKSSSSTHNMTSKFQIMHDEENIYIVVDVRDATPNNDEISIPNTYERDCIETFFSFKATNLDEGEYTDGDHEIRCQRANNNGSFIDGNSGAIELEASGDIQYGVVSDNDGYVAELAYNISALAGDSDFDGVNFRFEIFAADNTTGAAGGRTQQMFWNSNSDLQWNNTTYFGAMVLGGISGQTFPVSFTVTDENSIPIEGAAINLNGNGTQITNMAGKATFAGVYRVNEIIYSITKAGYKVSTGTISVIDAEVNENVVMTLNTYPVTFTVTNGTSIPIDSVAIKLNGYDAQLTDNNGIATFTKVISIGNIDYSATKFGFKSTTGTISVSNSAVYENIVLLLNTYPVTFTVTNEKLAPVEGATIELVGYGTKITNTDGKAIFAAVLPINDIAYSVTKTRYRVATGIIPVVNSAVNVNTSITLNKLPVTFTIIDENSFPIEGAEIKLTGYNTTQSTNTAGKALFEEVVSASNIAYIITKTGFRDTTGTVSVIDSAVFENIVMILDAYPVAFTVTDENALPLEGATIELTGYDSQITNSTGKVLFDKVMAANSIDYSITKSDYNTVTGSISVIDASVYQNIEMSLNTSISDFDEVGSLKVYPNPVSKTVSISSTQNIESLVISNLQGRVVLRLNEKLSKDKTYQIDISKLPCGVYLVRVDSKIARLVVE